MTKEPNITINGFQLSTAQATTMRVALEHFACDINQYGCGEDDIGKEIAKGYKDRICEIRNFIFKK